MELTYEQQVDLLERAERIATIKANGAQASDIDRLPQGEMDRPASGPPAPEPDRSKAVNVYTDDDLAQMASIKTNVMGKDSPHAKAFSAFLRGGVGALSPEQRRMTITRTNGLGEVTKTALVEGTGANGGFLVPVEYSNDIVEPMRRESVFRRPDVGARELVIRNAQSLKVPTQTDSAAATVIAEEGTFVESDPTFGQISFDPIKPHKLSKVSDEMLEDSPIDIWSNVLSPDFAQAFAVWENAGFGTGAGTVNVIPLGVTVGSTAGVTTASATEITAAELLTLFYSISDLHRQNAKWMMADSTVAKIRGLLDGNGQFLWQPGMQAGQPDMLFGKRVIVNPGMPAATAALIPIVFGDFSYYWIGDFDSAEIRVKRLDELFALTGQVGFRAYKRVDGNVMKATAFYKMTMHA